MGKTAQLDYGFQPARLAQMAYWVTERESIRKKKAFGLSRPWTTDPIMRDTRWCNVRRMDDKVSVWLERSWYPPAGATKGTILAAAGLARLINWPDALDALRNRRSGVFSKWDRERATKHFEDLKARGDKVFTGAYIINGAKGVSKVETVCRQVDTLYKHPELLDPKSMKATHAKLMTVKGIGSFMAGQMVADLRHVWPGEWADKLSWAPIGPGSHRGVNWLLGWDGVQQLSNMRQEVFEMHLGGLLVWFHDNLRSIIDDRQLEAHDVQNCLCEYDKFMRLTNGTGRAKNQYAGI